ncbi:hypothetical protein MTO96_028089 [Rhipicephalus appendiculatus]
MRQFKACVSRTAGGRFFDHRIYRLARECLIVFQARCSNLCGFAPEGPYRRSQPAGCLARLREPQSRTPRRRPPRTARRTRPPPLRKGPRGGLADVRQPSQQPTLQSQEGAHAAAPQPPRRQRLRQRATAAHLLSRQPHGSRVPAGRRGREPPAAEDGVRGGRRGARLRLLRAAGAAGPPRRTKTRMKRRKW